VQVRGYNTANIQGESQTITITVVDRLPAADAQIAATPTKESEPAPIAADTPIATPTSTPTASVAPTASPTPSPTLEPEPAPIVAATFPPTNFRPEGRFKTIWESIGGGTSIIGYPTGPQIDNRDFAKQYFVGGVMYWWNNPAGDNLVWVISVTDGSFQKGVQWHQFTDTWQGDGDHSCEETRKNGNRGPIRGFGKVWCEQQVVSSQLGDPVEEERGSGGNPPFSVVQFYQGGVMLYNPLNSEIFVLFHSGEWQQFGY
ncbi:MAG: hypothetical protein AAF629_13990, partial [Chloroflexota bacterium]